MKVKQMFILLVSVTVLLAGSMEMAVAHQFSDRTRLTLNVSDRNVQDGDTVVFSGRLISRHKRCRAHQVVGLYRDGVKVDQTRTNGKGFYSFKRKLFRTARWQVRFEGTVRGTHPHSHTCRPSRSQKVRVRVRDGGHRSGGSVGVAVVPKKMGAV